MQLLVKTRAKAASHPPGVAIAERKREVVPSSINVEAGWIFGAMPIGEPMKGAPGRPDSHAVTRQRPTSLVFLALVSAVVSALGFLVIATAVDGIRFSSEDPAEQPIAREDPLPEVVPPEDEGTQRWLPAFRQESAELELRLRELRFELEDTRAEAERHRRELEELVDELNRASGVR